jgi:hypothetical protein
VIVVDETDESIINALMIRYVGVGRMDTHRFSDDFSQRPFRSHQVIINLGCTKLIAIENVLFKLIV